MSHHLVGTAEIAEMLGVSRQRVSQLIEAYEDFPQPEVEVSAGRVWARTAVETWIASHPEREPGRPDASDEPRRPRFFGRKSGVLFERFTDRARNSIVKAQEEARLLNHNFIGTEHLVLGLLAIGEGVAWQVLSAQGVTLAAVREEIRRMVGEGDATPRGHIPFTPRSQKVLEIALREALQLGHNYVGTEHVLLAIVREGEGVGWQALALQGLKSRALRAEVLKALEAFPGRPKRRSVFSKPTAVPAHEHIACSFCGKPRTEVDRCVAGPGVYICDGCVRACVEILDESGVSVRGPGVDDRLQRLEERIARLESGG